MLSAMSEPELDFIAGTTATEIVDSVERAVRQARLGPGDRLPPIRQLGVGGGVALLLAAVAAAGQLGAVGADHDGADRDVVVGEGGLGLGQGDPHPALGGGGVHVPPTMTVEPTRRHTEMVDSATILLD